MIAITCWEIVACVLLADFLTGLGHWFEDAYSVPTWPVLGKLLAEPNINHHLHPTEMAPSFFGRNGYQLVPVLIALLMLYLCGWLTWQVSLVGILVAMGNETHSWCHRKVGSFIHLLQDLGIVVSPKQHNSHHKAPYQKAYCTLTNFVNPVLDFISFWETIEFLISLLGIHPKRLTEARNYV